MAETRGVDLFLAMLSLGTDAQRERILDDLADFARRRQYEASSQTNEQADSTTGTQTDVKTDEPVFDRGMFPCDALYDVVRDEPGIYHDLSDGHVMDIAMEREVVRSSSERFSYIRNVLRRLDAIEPGWLIQLWSTSVADLPILSMSKLVLWSVLHQIPVTSFNKPSAYRRYIALVLALQEGFFIPQADKKFLKRLSRSELVKLLAIMPSQPKEHFTAKLPTKQIYEVLMGGQVTFNDENCIRVGRYDSIMRTSQGAQLIELYEVEKLEEVIDKNMHPLEPAIWIADKYNPYTLAARLGVLFPLDLPVSDWRSYIIRNIVEYKEVVLRRKKSSPPSFGSGIPLNAKVVQAKKWRESYVEQLTDEEITTWTGVDPCMSSRRKLVEATCLSYDQPIFFFPRDNNRRYATNKVTISNLHDVTDLTVPMIAFGTWTHYIVYEITDLMAAFDDHDGVCWFRRPENINTYFTDGDIVTLRAMLVSLARGARAWDSDRCMPLAQGLSDSLLNVTINGVNLTSLTGKH